MRKILFIIFLFPLFWVGLAFSDLSYTWSSGLQECEGQLDDNSWQKWIPSINSPSVGSNWTITCTKNGYYSWSWGPWQALGSHYACPWDGYGSNIEYSGNNFRIYCKVLDNTPPSPSDVTSSLSDGWYYMANIANISITWVPGTGSPIVRIDSEFEEASNEGSLFVRSYSGSVSSFLEDFSKVDVDNRNDVTVNNYRPYTHNITLVCDEAWNCVNDIKTFTYNIYANNVNTWVSQVIWDTQLVDGSNIADGESNIITLSLRDIYGNKIIPVYQSDSLTKVRDVSIKMDYDNDLYLNQYTKSGESGVSLKGPTDWWYNPASIQSWADKTNTLTDKTQISWDYAIDFKVYTPTSSIYSKATGWFLINSLKSVVSDIVWEITLSSLLNFRFNPLYKLDIAWDIKTNGLSSGTQSGTILMTQNWGSSSATDKNLYLEFGSGVTNVVSPKMNMEQLVNAPYSPLWEWNGNKSLFESNFATTSYPLVTHLTLSWGLLTDIETSYLSTHIEYNLDSKAVVYNSDIIWKDHYWGSFTGANLIQKWVKILWKTHSQKQEDILSDQDTDDIHILWDIEKSDLKQEIRKKVYEMLRKVSANNGTGRISDLDGDGLDTWIWDNLDGVSLQNDTVLYFWDLGGSDISLNVWPTHTMKWNKTIVVVWWNLYIESDIVNDTDSDILWVIVLKDENDNGWNIYVNPSVTRVDGILYADKSLLSYDGVSELDSNTVNAILANQLYIYGSLFSENTIWWSAKEPPDCPYYVDCSDVSIAQKYDLNFLRSYRMRIDGTASNGWMNYFATYDSSYPYYTFPVVIKYNSKIQTWPPPLFEQN